MSTTTLYSIRSDGSIDEFAEYQNSHGFAPAIWTVLTAKYVPMGMPLGGDSDARMMAIMEGRKTWLLDTDHCFKHMGEAADDGTMSDAEALCYAVTMDFAVVEREYLTRVADAFDQFVANHGPSLDGHVLHLAEMAGDLRRLVADETSRGACWNTTSLADTFAALVYDSDEDDEGRPYNIDRDARHHLVRPE